MALTVVKYRKPIPDQSSATPSILIKSKLQTSNMHNKNIHQHHSTLQSQPQHQHQRSLLDINKKQLIKLGGSTGLVINKIPAIIKPATMKRGTSFNTASEHVQKTAKYSLQTIASAGTPLTSFQWQPTVGSVSAATTKKQQLGAAINSLPPNTIIKATSNGTSSMLNQNLNSSAVASPVSSVQVRRPTIFIKREMPERTIRSVTLELIDKNPLTHLGVPMSRLQLLKNTICATANVPLVECYMTLKKLRQNEEFSLLAEYFEMTEGDAQHAFARTVVKLARYLRFLINWPDSKKYYDRHKNLPFAFRQNLSHVQSLIECVEADMPASPLQIECSSYKFILSISTNGIISHISDAFIGHHDDVTLFKVSNFKNFIPKYLTLVADPGKGIRRKQKQKTARINHQQASNKEKDQDSSTDSADESADDLLEDETTDTRLSKYIASRVAGELASNQSLSVVNNELTSRRVHNYAIPTMKVSEIVCRQQMRQMVSSLQEYRILQSLAVKEPLVYQYLNEIMEKAGTDSPVSSQKGNKCCNDFERMLNAFNNHCQFVGK